MLSCQNPTCQKNFTSPLKTLNLRETPTQPYLACPFCLTKVNAVDEALKDKAETKETSVGKLQIIPAESEDKKNDKPSECRYHVGYLSERAQKEQIPDDCLVCKDIVECMLRKMRD